MTINRELLEALKKIQRKALIDPLHSMSMYDISAIATDAIAAAESAVSEPDPTHPQYVAGFKAGTYAGKRRLEMLPEDTPKPEIGSVTCMKCGHQQVSFLVAPPAAPLPEPLTNLKQNAVPHGYSLVCNRCGKWAEYCQCKTMSSNIGAKEQ